MARRKDKTIGEKMDSKEKKVEKSKIIKHTTWAHGDDTWNVMCARQTYDLSHACACHLLCNTEKNVTCEVCCSPRLLPQTAVSCKRSDYNEKNLAKCHFWAAFVKKLLLFTWAFLLIVMSSTSGHSTATMMCWMKKMMDAIADTGRKEPVRVALLQTHGEDGASLLMLRWSLIGVSSVHCVQMCWERSTNSFGIVNTRRTTCDRWNLSAPTRPSRCFCFSPINFELRITKS